MRDARDRGGRRHGVAATWSSRSRSTTARRSPSTPGTRGSASSAACPSSARPGSSSRTRARPGSTASGGAWTSPARPACSTWPVPPGSTSERTVAELYGLPRAGPAGHGRLRRCGAEVPAPPPGAAADDRRRLRQAVQARPGQLDLHSGRSQVDLAALADARPAAGRRRARGADRAGRRPCTRCGWPRPPGVASARPSRAAAREHVAPRRAGRRRACTVDVVVIDRRRCRRSAAARSASRLRSRRRDAPRGRVEVAVRGTARAVSTGPTRMTAVRRTPASRTASGDVGQRAAQDQLVRLARPRHHRDRAVRAVVRGQLGGQLARSAAPPGAGPASRPVAASVARSSPSGIGRRARLRPGQDHASGPPSGTVSSTPSAAAAAANAGTPGVTSYGTPAASQPAHLLGQRAQHRRVARAAAARRPGRRACGRDHLGDDLVQVEVGGVDQPAPAGSASSTLGGDQAAGVQADRRTRPAAAAPAR